MFNSGVVGVLKTKNMFLFLLYLVIALFIIPYVGQGLPYSIFYASTYQHDHNELLLDNSLRIKSAMRTLNHLNCKGKCWNNQATTTPEFCFVVISVSRPAETKFLTQVVAALLPQLPQIGSVFTVYNAEGLTHKEAINLSDIVPVDSYTGKSSPNVYAKESNDLVHALEWCHNRSARFSVILEDDALPRQDFVQRVQFILDHRMSKSSKTWAFLKLYYPEKWQGWANDKSIVIELILCSVSGGLILTLVVHFLQFLFTRAPEMDYGIVIQFLLSSSLTVYVLICLGRPHWMALRSISPWFSSVVYAPGCCTPAVLYPQTHLSDIIQYLDNAECSHAFPLDLAIDKFADESGLHRLLATPNLVKHIGFLSSLPGKGWKNPKEFRLKYI